MILEATSVADRDAKARVGNKVSWGEASIDTTWDDDSSVSIGKERQIRLLEL